MSAVTSRAEALAGRQAAGPDPRRWRALTVCLVAGFMTLLDVSIVNVAIPSIRQGLGASASDIQWVLSGYSLAYGLVLVPTGRLGDARGRRTVFMAGLALFTLASAACGLAPGPVWLVVARLLQGIGGGTIAPQVSALIQTMFRGAERGRAFGLFGLTVGVSTAVGPLLGGTILATVPGEQAWRWIFLVNLPIGIGALVLARGLLPADSARRARQPLDLPGVALLAVALLLVLLPMLETGADVPAALWLTLPIGLVLASAFLRWERQYARRGNTPLVDLALLRRRSYAAGMSIAALYFAGFTSIFFTFTLFLQVGHGYTPLEAGLAQTPFAVGGAVSAPLAGRVITRIGRPLVVIGLGLVLAGLAGAWLAVRLVDGPSVGWWAALPLLVAGVGSGVVISPNITLTLAEVPVVQAGSAGGVLQTAQRVGGAAGIAGVGAAFFHVLQGGQWRPAIETSFALCGALVTCSLVVAVLDVRGGRRPRPAHARTS